MNTVVRRIGIAASTLALTLGLGIATAAPASAASNCHTVAVDPTAGGYVATITCTNTDRVAWSISIGGTFWQQQTVPMTFKSVGNTPDDAVNNATWVASNSNSTVYCTDVQTSAVPGGYNVVYTCPGGNMPYPHASQVDLNTAVSWANYMWILYR